MLSKFLGMKKKLFNYFLKKAVRTEQLFLGGCDDVKLAALEVIFAKMTVQREYASGGIGIEEIYLWTPKYAQELFLIVCMEAAAHGDNLLQIFNFKPCTTYIYGQNFPDMQDSELTNYIEQEIYPEAKNIEKEKDFYAKFFMLPIDKIDMKKVYARGVNINVLENLPEPCPETEMIDRAWERLMQDDRFIPLFNHYAKYAPNGLSNAYERYSKSPFFQK